MLARTARIKHNKKGVYSTEAQFELNEQVFTNTLANTKTFGSLLADSNQVRRLLNYDKAAKGWKDRSKLYSQKCHRKHDSITLLERSDHYAVKLQEIDQISKNSKPMENTDAHNQWIFSLRQSKEPDSDKCVYLALSTKNPLSS